jgi:endonuclease-3
VSPNDRPASARGSSATRPPKSAAAAKSARSGTATKSARSAPRASRPPHLDPDEIARAWAAQLASERPDLIPFVLDRLAETNGRPVWERRLDPTSELVLTILSQNSADTNAEAAFAALRAAYPSAPAGATAPKEPRAFPGWGGRGLPDLPPPDWSAVDAAPLAELIDVIRPGGLAPQKAPRIQAALRALLANGSGYSLEFLAAKPPLEARDWLSAIPGIGKKTASVVLLFSFGTPLMPVDRHVHRVSQRIGLIPPKVEADQAHDLYLAMLAPEQMYETHVSLITHGRRTCHAQRPDCEHCPLAPRCRYFDPKAE